MEWFTTNEAAEALKISSTRVRQLVQKHKSNKELVKSTKKKTRTIYSVSTKFIEVCQTNRANFNDNLLKVGEPIEQPNGTIIEVFTPKQVDKYKTIIKQHAELSDLVPRYEAIKKELTEIEERFKDHIADLRNERNYLRKSLDNQQEQFSKLLQAVQQRNLIEATEKGIKPNEND
jgi:hypothetical protein